MADHRQAARTANLRSSSIRSRPIFCAPFPKRVGALLRQISYARLPCGTIGRALQAAADVCSADPGAGAAGREGLGPRFRWLTAPRSTVIQPGPVHGGITTDPDSVLDSLMQALVLG